MKSSNDFTDLSLIAFSDAKSSVKEEYFETKLNEIKDFYEEIIYKLKEEQENDDLLK
jgi:hypothetical protein